MRLAPPCVKFLDLDEMRTLRKVTILLRLANLPNLIMNLVLPFFLLIESSDCISQEFFYQTLELQNHSDVVYITDSIPESIPGNFIVRQQFSHVKQLRLDSTFLNKLSNSDSNNVKFVISYPTNEETLVVVSQIASPPLLMALSSKLWAVVLWPEGSSNSPVLEQNPEQVIQTHFAKALPNITIDQEFYIAFRDRSIVENVSSEIPMPLTNGTYVFYEMYTVNQQLNFRKVPGFDPAVVCDECESLPNRRFNLKGLRMTVEGVEDPEYNDDTLFTETENGELALDECLSKRLLAILQQKLNFTVKLVRGSEWGRQSSDGKWIGAVQDILEEKADICVTATYMLPKRAGVISYLHPTQQNTISAFFREPSLNAIRDIFMQPFQPTLWAAVIATWLTLASAMVAFTIIRKRFGADETFAEAGIEEPDFTQDSLIWALATICQQGWDEHPYALSLRAIFISASFTGVIAYAGYSAAIVSTLSLRIDPIQSPEALIKSNLRLGIRSGFFNDVLLVTDDKDPTNYDIVTEIKSSLSKVRDEAEVNITMGAFLLRKNPYAFIGTTEAFYDIMKVSKPVKGDIHTNICEIRELRILHQGYKSGMFTRKRFPYKEFFRIVLLIIRERGVLWRIRDEFTYTRRCLESTDTSGRALGANDVFTAFMILLAGHVLSVTFLMMEKLTRINKTVYIK